MFLLTATLILSFVCGFAFPPFWVLTFLCGRQIIRIGRARHLEQHRAAELARMKLYLQVAKP